MFKRDVHGEFVITDKKGGWFSSALWECRFRSGKLTFLVVSDRESYEKMLNEQNESPLVVASNDAKRIKWWTFRGNFYCENEGFSKSEVKALAMQDEIKREQKIERAISIIEERERLRNPPVTRICNATLERQGDVYCINTSSDVLNGDFTIPASGLNKLVRIRRGNLTFYFYKDAIYKFEKDFYSSQHMLSLIAELESPRRRLSIPRKIRIEVWKRCDGKCVECGSKDNLEFDHVIPFSRGGSNTERNLQLLCEQCNRRKSANI